MRRKVGELVLARPKEGAGPLPSAIQNSDQRFNVGVISSIRALSPIAFAVERVWWRLPFQR